MAAFYHTRVPLAPAPSSFLNVSTGAPAFGAYEGPLPAVRWPAPGLSLSARALRRKKWVYLAIAGDEVWISLAVVRTGYAATAFAFVHELGQARMLADKTAIAPSFAARVADDPHARGSVASFSFGATRVACDRDTDGLVVRARIGAIEVDATLAAAGAPTAITAIAHLGEGLANATEKRALLAVRGHARVGDRMITLDGAVGGYDYTHGLLPRRTRWHWAFALGRDVAGEPIAFNFVEGFVGSAECAAFTGGRAHPLPEPRFVFGEPSKPWSLEADGVDLTFAPGAVHAQHTNLGLVRSRFVQPVGTFSGSLVVTGRERRIARLPGVVEDQDVVW
jgi:hypothetical protein